MSDDKVVQLGLDNGVSRKTQVSAEKFYDGLWDCINEAAENELPYNVAVGVLELVKFRFICSQEASE